MRVGWIGLGNMGRGMVSNLIAKGKYDGKVLVYNRTQSKSEPFKDTAEVCSSAKDLIQMSDLIFTILSDDTAILESYQSFLDQADVKGKTFADASTVHPETTQQLQQLVHRAGAAFVACPVFGAPPMAQSGNLVIVLAGDSSALQVVRPFCKSVMGKAVVEVGNEVSKATALKVTGNTLILSMVTSLAEANVLAEKSGLDTDHLLQFVDNVFAGPYTAYSKRMTGGDYLASEPAFAVDLARKDARHAKHLADKAGVVISSNEPASSYLQEVRENQGSKGDIASIYGVVRKRAGLAYEVPRKS